MTVFNVTTDALALSPFSKTPHAIKLVMFPEGPHDVWWWITAVAVTWVALAIVFGCFWAIIMNLWGYKDEDDE